MKKNRISLASLLVALVLALSMLTGFAIAEETATEPAVEETVAEETAAEVVSGGWFEELGPYHPLIAFTVISDV